MRNLLCITAIALMGVGTLPALAADDGASPEVVEITAPRSATATATVQAVPTPRVEDARHEMSNGSRLAVTSYGDIVKMRYNSRAAQLLRHDGQGNFVSRDGSLTLKFENDMHGNTQLVRLSAPATWF